MTGLVLLKNAALFMFIRDVKLFLKDLSGITVDEWNKERTSIVYNSYYQWVTIQLLSSMGNNTTTTFNG